ncbi:PA0069 family radical SAM protein [Pseudomarimonas salicorniae]|uniref:PA0069 family radical SAM protein n=1 Tax=Pseudomarimonas salicorniae TaxID=2933270 RepID=A0ABT0GG06_9GAMM|nr:PA0069 family radical SAM protein [Lysobacter sp. CAU 1642]MCK7593468.1 PA0069 family radical SAM protein [Lysobacter sp. CAU 1642]
MAPGRIKGRGSAWDQPGRFESTAVDASAQADEGWEVEAALPPGTTVVEERARSIISRNSSPDIPFSQSINPYRGCEHGCSYCFARPSHAYLNLSPGIDFETRLFAKTNAAELLRAELALPGYRCEPITLGANTDPYQPIERRFALTRQLIDVLSATRHPFSLITKNALVERDLDLLAPLGREGLCSVMVSVTTLDNRLSARLEPRASAPARRLRCIRTLREAGVPVGVLVAPVIPAVNDAEIERILEAVAEAGALSAGYVLLRLPHEVAPIFRDWLAQHLPDRAAHVMSLVQQLRGGRDYDARFGQRMRGQGPFADLLAQRFAIALRRHGLDRERPALDCSRFQPPRKPQAQGDLFG